MGNPVDESLPLYKVWFDERQYTEYIVDLRAQHTYIAVRTFSHALHYSADLHIFLKQQTVSGYNEGF